MVVITGTEKREHSFGFFTRHGLGSHRETNSSYLAYCVSVSVWEKRRQDRERECVCVCGEEKSNRKLVAPAMHASHGSAFTPGGTAATTITTAVGPPRVRGVMAVEDFD
ncbi:hypothetical protein BHE74_00025876 [Ensete ventricosum]|nr:hypothetical protein BHE74_00025876 [Ensete ventricosum]